MVLFWGSGEYKESCGQPELSICEARYSVLQLVLKYIRSDERSVAVCLLRVQRCD